VKAGVADRVGAPRGFKGNAVREASLLMPRLSLQL
jgi:hypothetical protein